MAKLSMIILYVADQQRSKEFYSKVLEKAPRLDMPGMSEFELTSGFLLGLMPEQGINKILAGATPHPANGNGIPRCELYLIVENVNTAFKTAISAGAKKISLPGIRDWGDEVAYCADPDGHVVAFANSI